MKTDEEQELRNAAKWLRLQARMTSSGNALVYNAELWAAMLERAADRIQELEAHLERFVA